MYGWPRTAEIQEEPLKVLTVKSKLLVKGPVKFPKHIQLPPATVYVETQLMAIQCIGAANV